MAVKKATAGNAKQAASAKTGTATSGGEVSTAAAAGTGDIAAATTFDPSGAPNQVSPGVDVDHPAVDANPRANTTQDQNRIDFNDPHLSGAEAVEMNLEEQGKK